MVLAARRLRGLARQLRAFLASLALAGMPAHAEEALIAVATNFATTAEKLESAFETAGGSEIVIVPGSTGRLFAQIVNGAPFNAFLSADDHHPKLLEEMQIALPGSKFTYALGRLAIWSADAAAQVDGLKVANAGAEPGRIAVADPRLAPYGRAAMTAMRNIGIPASESSLVYGESVGQTYSFVATGNARLGFVSLSYLLSPRHSGEGASWTVPEEFHDPIVQDAVLLKRDSGRTAARAFLKFLRSDEGLGIISAFGYGVPALER